MYGSFDRSGKKTIYQRWGIGFLALPVLLATMLIALAFIQPTTSNWISETVQAEFTGTNLAPEIAPTQFAQPVGEIRAVRAN